MYVCVRACACEGRGSCECARACVCACVVGMGRGDSVGHVFNLCESAYSVFRCGNP